MRREAFDGPEVSTYAARYPTVANVPGSGVKRQRATWHFEHKSAVQYLAANVSTTRDTRHQT